MILIDRLDKNDRMEIYSNICISFFAVITIIWLGPLEIFSANSFEFSFAFKDYWWMMFAYGLIVSAILILFFFLLPNKIACVGRAFLFAFVLCCYIQAMFLNGSMESLLNQRIVWSRSLKISNAVIWMVIIVILLFLNHNKRKKLSFVITILSVFMSSIQIIAIVSLLFTSNILKEDKNGYLSVKDMNVLAKNNNVIVFILDYYDGRLVEETFKQRPDLMEGLDGFVYYPNSTSVHSRTYPSIPYLFTERICYFDKEPKEYIKESFEENSLIRRLSDNNVNVGYYGFDYYLSDSDKILISNYESQNLDIDIIKICKYMTKMVLYRDLPYFFKGRFEYDIDDINDSVTIGYGINKNATGNEAFKTFNDTWFGEYIDENGIKTNEEYNASYRFYHLGSCHRNLTNPIPYGIESFEIVENYLQQLRNVGLYNMATIIIMADHGFSGGGEIGNVLPFGTAVPLMLVKRAGEEAKPMIISDIPVSHADFYPTVCDSFGILSDDIGTPIYDIDDINRKRKYYYTALISDEEGEVVLQEYDVVGDAREPDSYVFTGNTWKVLYSLNKVASE